MNQHQTLKFMEFLVIVLSFQMEAYSDDAFDWVPAWRESSDCGQNAAFFVCKLMGCRDTQRTLRNELPIKAKRGVSLFQIEEYLNSKSLDFVARWSPPDEIEKLAVPVIVHLKPVAPDTTGHFSVLLSADPATDSFSLFDTSYGTILKLDGNAFRSLVTGYVVCARPSTTLENFAVFGVSTFVSFFMFLVVTCCQRTNRLRSRCSLNRSIK